MLAAEAAFESLDAPPTSAPIDLSHYEENLKASWVYKELYDVRNIRPSFHSSLGLYGGMLWSGVDLMLLGGRVPFTFKHGPPDHQTLKPKSQCTEIVYPPPDNLVSFDLLTNLSRSGTNHAEDQPVHLTLKDCNSPVEVNLKVYDGPESRFCPG